MDLSKARHALVTGGASGFGLAIGDALARAGLSVTLADIDEAALAKALTERGEQFNAAVLDNRDRDQWQAVRQAAEAKFGPVDILVNNAGIAPNGQQFADMDPAAFDRMVAISLTGVFNGIATFAADMRARGTGHIVNTASIAGLTLAHPGVGGYSAAKFGVIGFSEVLRKELEPHGIGVSVLCPGFVRTNLSENTAKLTGSTGAERPASAISVTSQMVNDGGVNAGMVAEHVLTAIRRNLPYIVTHVDNLSRLQARVDKWTAAFHAAPTVERAEKPLDTSRFRHAFVTGGASGIGLGIVDALLRQGLKVTVADIDAATTAATVAQRGASAQSAVLDVRERAQWQAAKQAAEATFGPVDILVNNAGIAADGDDLADTDPASFDRMIAINLTGVFNGVSAFAADMRARGSGHIVNTASMVAVLGGIAGMASYAASKCGVLSLTEALRRELAEHGVGASSLCPGYVNTNLHANTVKVGGIVKKKFTPPPNTGLAASIVGERVAQAIAENLAYIISHEGYFAGVETRMNAMLAAFGDYPLSENRSSSASAPVAEGNRNQPLSQGV